MAGTLLTNALIPEPLQGVRPPILNKIEPYDCIPRVYGMMRFFPPAAAQPYYHDKQVWYLFNLGYGRLDVRDIRVGDDPITDYMTERTADNPEGGFEVREGYAGEAARTITPPRIPASSWKWVTTSLPMT